MALTDNLISYWKMDEASGNAVDAHGSNTLTDNNTVTSATGQVYGTARSFAGGSSESLSATDPASLSFSGNQDFTISLWVYMPSLPGFGPIFGKWNTAGPAQSEYAIMYESSGGFNFHISNGTTLGECYGSTVTANSWNMVTVWHDATADLIYNQVNNGTPASAAHSVGVWDNGFDLRVGRANTDYFTGRIGPAAIWSRVLDSTDRSSLWNSGAGLAYASFGGGAAFIARPNARQIQAINRASRW